MIQKDGKPAESPDSYRPISLLPVVAKLYEKLLLQRLPPLIEKSQLIPDVQFVFRTKHSTIEQIHRVVAVIHEAFENKEFCSELFSQNCKNGKLSLKNYISANFIARRLLDITFDSVLKVFSFYVNFSDLAIFALSHDFAFVFMK